MKFSVNGISEKQLCWNSRVLWSAALCGHSHPAPQAKAPSSFGFVFVLRVWKIFTSLSYRMQSSTTNMDSPWSYYFVTKEKSPDPIMFWFFQLLQQQDVASVLNTTQSNTWFLASTCLQSLPFTGCVTCTPYHSEPQFFPMGKGNTLLSPVRQVPGG